MNEHLESYIEELKKIEGFSYSDYSELSSIIAIWIEHFAERCKDFTIKQEYIDEADNFPEDDKERIVTIVQKESLLNLARRIRSIGSSNLFEQEEKVLQELVKIFHALWF